MKGFVTIGQYVRSHREEKKLTIENLAEMCNVSDKCISNIELDISIPKTDTFFRICHVMDVDMGDLNMIGFEEETVNYEVHLSMH